MITYKVQCFLCLEEGKDLKTTFYHCYSILLGNIYLGAKFTLCLNTHGFKQLIQEIYILVTPLEVCVWGEASK